MGELIKLPGMPDAYRQKAVVAVKAENPGWLLKFACGHVVWCAVEARVGDAMYCGVCVDNLHHAGPRVMNGGAMKTTQPRTQQQDLGDAEAFVLMMAEMQERNCSSDSTFYPPAAWLARHGRSWPGPVEHAPVVGWWKKRQCFENAFKYAQEHGVTYVEGWAVNIIPTQHAWCIAPDGRIIDPTWGSEGRDYFGAEIPLDTLYRIQLATEVYGVFSGCGWDQVAAILPGGTR